MTAADHARLTRAAADPAVAQLLAPGDDQRSILLALGAVWAFVLLFAAYICVALLPRVPGFASLVGASREDRLVWKVAVAAACLLLFAPAVWLNVVAARLLRLPERRALVVIVDRMPRGLHVAGLDIAARVLVPRLKAVLESSGGGLRPGALGVAVVRGDDQLVDWHPVRDGA